MTGYKNGPCASVVHVAVFATCVSHKNSCHFPATWLARAVQTSFSSPTQRGLVMHDLDAGISRSAKAVTLKRVERDGDFPSGNTIFLVAL